MNDFLIINQIFVFLIVTIGLWLGFWALFADRKNRLNQIFFIITLLIIFWNIFAYLGFSANESEKAVIWYRLNFGMVSLFFLAAYFFVIYFPKKITENNFLSKIVIFLTVISFFLSIFTDLIVKNTIIKEWGAEIVFGSLGFIPFKGFSALLIIIILYCLFKKYFILEKQEKLKIQYVLIGVLIFALFNTVFNIIFPLVLGTVKYQHFGDFSAIFLLGFFAYAIVKHQLFEIKVVLTSLLVGLIAILLAVDLFLFTPDLWIQIIKGFILIIFLFFGYYLIRSVLREIKRREELEDLTLKLQVSNVKLEATYKKLEKLDKAKSEFISITSHQLRTPLTAIKGYISMIIDGTYGELREEAKRPMENVYRSNERLIKLVNQLLNLSKLEAGKIQFEPKPCSLEKIVSEVIDELKINAEKKGLSLRMEKTEDLPETLIDEDKLRQVLLNLLDNAIKYTQRGGVVIELKKRYNYQEIRISDTGEGMTGEEIKDLFQSFSRASAGTQLHIEGAGIGLYIAKKFIEMHQGKIWAESPGKGKGSTFYIQLPMNIVTSNQ
jgi:signal transduction histidine kinase